MLGHSSTMQNLNSDYTFVFCPDTVEKKEWPAEGRTINLIWQPAKLCEGQPLWCQTVPWQYGLWHWPRTTSNSQDAHIPKFISPFPLFVKKSLIPKVCAYVCVCMYVQNLTIGLEHINQKRWAIPHCVLRVIHHSASCVRRDKPGSSLFIWSIPTVRAWWSCQEDNRHSSYMLTLSRLGDA